MAIPEEHPHSNSVPAATATSTTDNKHVAPPVGITSGGTPKTPAYSLGDSKNTKDRATWSGKIEFLLSAVGFAVGLGNIWRFPYLCYKNGGGAFLIPYVLMLTVLGLPLFFLELAFGQYASLGSLTIWRICPLFKGLGYTMYSINALISVYYNVLIGYTLFYFFASFQSPVPWSTCDNWWNTARCMQRKNSSLVTSNLNSSLVGMTTTISDNPTSLPPSDNSTLPPRSPAEEYWEFRVLGLSDVTNITHLGEVRWHVTLCLLLSWIIVFLCLFKGIKSSGKVVYFSATYPYVVLFILFIRGVTLEGAGEGVKYYLTPDFHKMTKVEVWKDAAIQIIYSLGVGGGSLLTMGSFNKFNNNCQRDAIMVALINCGTSIFAGFVIFSVLGHMAHDAGVSVDHVVDSGPGLAFVAYPEGLSLMAGAPFWSLMFFFMLFNLGLDSQFAGMEGIVTGLTDEFPVLFRYKTLVTSGICCTMFLAGLPCVTSGGMYVIELLDKFATTFPLLFIVFFEVIVINWIYGFRRWSRDVECMMGFRPNYYWLACWVGLTPLVIVVILVFSCIQYDGIAFHGYVFPPWAEVVGWLIPVMPLAMIPAWMVYKVVKCIGSCERFGNLFRRPTSIKDLDLGSLVRPSHEWGPALAANREGLDSHTYQQMADDTANSSIEVTTNDRRPIIVNTDMYGGDSYI